MQTFTLIPSTRVSWQEYKALRLEALQKEPHSFASTYQEELQTPDEEWKVRLDNYRAGVSSWMCFASNGEELVGMLGAFQSEEMKLDNSAMIIAVYVKKEARKKGVGKMLLHALLEELKIRQITKAILIVGKEQIAAIKLYESLGFTDRNNEREFSSYGESYKDKVYMEKLLS